MKPGLSPRFYVGVIVASFLEALVLIALVGVSFVILWLLAP
jgi:hypothetical protein